MNNLLNLATVTRNLVTGTVGNSSAFPMRDGIRVPGEGGVSDIETSGDDAERIQENAQESNTAGRIKTLAPFLALLILKCLMSQLYIILFILISIVFVAKVGENVKEVMGANKHPNALRISLLFYIALTSFSILVAFVFLHFHESYFSYKYFLLLPDFKNVNDLHFVECLWLSICSDVIARACVLNLKMIILLFQVDKCQLRNLHQLIKNIWYSSPAQSSLSDLYVYFKYYVYTI